jgi:lipopolysaccharide transport system ATP-binding protein
VGRLWRGAAPAGADDFWALRDVSFSVPAGEAVGIIGRNGAGKSTLLKMLARVTLPTAGSIRLRGRVSSLLEVGTGFHPDLTARQNIFLNGAILGMRRREIERCLDEIVDYAGVADFLNEPVKHLSTGLYMRLAFAVSAFLESEIMIVDEVLAVGDAVFQEKCLGTMSNAARGGRTVLFVSHNAASIAQLTRRCIVLDHGRVLFDGPTPAAIQHYQQTWRQNTFAGRQPTETLVCERHYRNGDDFVIREIGLASGKSPVIGPRGDVELEFVVEARRAARDLRILYALNSAAGHPAITGLSPPFAVQPGRHTLALTLQELPLVPGQYDFTVSLGRGGQGEGKEEYDAYIRFGQLSVLEVTADGKAFGGWHPEWAAVFHTASSIRRA